VTRLLATKMLATKLLVPAVIAAGVPQLVVSAACMHVMTTNNA
jgi:hypothetical protein